jgi:hypothetical protein
MRIQNDQDSRLSASALFLQQAGVAGHALPLAILENPGIGEAAEMVVGLAVIGTFGVIDTGHDPGIVIQVHPQILDRDQAGLELWVFDIGQKLPPLADLAVPLRVHERVGDHALQCALVAIHLGVVPKTLEHNQLGRLRIVFIANRLPEGPQRDQKKAED